MSKNTGKAYELFVQSLYQAILQSELLSGQKNIEVETNKLLVDKNGTERQFDIYWEYSLGGFLYKTVIECKDYASKISIDKIDSLLGKLQDFPELRGVFATKVGYQSGAEIKANNNNIELLIVRQQNDSDWEDEDGTPLIREINIGMTVTHPARITGFNIFMPKETEHKTPLSLSGMNNEIIIINEDTNAKFSMFDLQHILLDDHKNESGIFEKVCKFKGKIITADQEVDILGYKVSYIIPKPSKDNILIDYSEKLIGVIEYLSQGRKAIVFDDHIRYENKKILNRST
ncbi:restriction endonuclease [Acinetobacter sp. YH12098]|uniref:restriction endonuclease n=1 Tax=Acinetobacter sp. YH12098 TaxID=2601087 RepID=UPI0015D251EC|nr:restriction endonuclease [Acinetobacter sp. YH12098]